MRLRLVWAVLESPVSKTRRAEKESYLIPIFKINERRSVLI
jgi:hypothetical protein